MPGRRKIGKADYQARGVMYVPEAARFSYLKALPEGTDIGAALNDAMDAIKAENPDLKGVLPHDYGRFDNTVLAELLRLIGSVLTTSKGTPSARSTSTSSATSPSPRASEEESSSRRPRSSN